MKRRELFLCAGLGLMMSMGVGQGCSPLSPAKENTVNASTGEGKCKPPPGVSGIPKTIEDTVALINSLPKPVSVACFIESLSRPLNVSLTNNAFSAQPAVGNRSPRIFIISDKLFISVVPEGPGQDVAEFSFMTSTDTSIKAEIGFPVVQALSASAPYDRILYGSGTACVFCHSGENATPLVSFANAFVSRALRPNPATKVELEDLRTEVAKCNPGLEQKRCELLKALFGNGELRSQDFPADMPSF